MLLAADADSDQAVFGGSGYVRSTIVEYQTRHVQD